MTKTLLAAATILFALAGYASAAVDPLTSLPFETQGDIYNRCGVFLNSPGAIITARGQPCNLAKLAELMEPREQKANDDR